MRSINFGTANEQDRFKSAVTPVNPLGRRAAAAWHGGIVGCRNKAGLRGRQGPPRGDPVLQAVGRVVLSRANGQRRQETRCFSEQTLASRRSFHHRCLRLLDHRFFLFNDFSVGCCHWDRSSPVGDHPRYGRRAQCYSTAQPNVPAPPGDCLGTSEDFGDIVMMFVPDPRRLAPDRLSIIGIGCHVYSSTSILDLAEDRPTDFLGNDFWVALASGGEVGHEVIISKRFHWLPLGIPGLFFQKTVITSSTG
jgi:hypothetical protein